MPEVVDLTLATISMSLVSTFPASQFTSFIMNLSVDILLSFSLDL